MRQSGEDYLEAIWVLKNQKGSVRSIDVARHMEYSKPSVSRAVSILRRDGYLLMEEDGELVLTESGQKLAETIYERHTVLTEVLISLGVSDKTAAEDACNLEHAMSEETFGRIKEWHKALRKADAAKPDTKATASSEEKKKKKKKKKKN